MARNDFRNKTPFPDLPPNPLEAAKMATELAEKQEKVKKEEKPKKEAPKPAVIIESVDSESVDLNDYEELKRELEKKKKKRARKNNRTTVMITDKALVGLEIGAAKEGTTRNDLVNKILEEYADEVLSQ